MARRFRGTLKRRDRVVQVEIERLLVPRRGPRQKFRSKRMDKRPFRVPLCETKDLSVLVRRWIEVKTKVALGECGLLTRGKGGEKPRRKGHDCEPVNFS